MCAKWDSFHMLHRDLAGGAFKRSGAAVTLNMCVCLLLPVCMYICLPCVVLCWQPVGMAGVTRGLLDVKFYEGFCKCEVAVTAVSSPLLQSLTPASKVSPTEFSVYCCRIVYLGS